MSDHDCQPDREGPIQDPDYNWHDGQGEGGWLYRMQRERQGQQEELRRYTPEEIQRNRLAALALGVVIAVVSPPLRDMALLGVAAGGLFMFHKQIFGAIGSLLEKNPSAEEQQRDGAPPEGRGR